MALTKANYGEITMTVKELIDKLSEFDSDLRVFVQYLNGEPYGECWQDIEDFDEDDVKVDDDIVILDISDRYH